MNRIYVIILVLGIIGSYHQAFSSPIDSLRLETIDGKSYIIHQVDPGETLYSISKRYQCTMNAIAEASPEVKRGLANGMTIRVPSNSSKKPAVAGETLQYFTDLRH